MRLFCCGVTRVDGLTLFTLHLPASPYSNVHLVLQEKNKVGLFFLLSRYTQFVQGNSHEDPVTYTVRMPYELMVVRGRCKVTKKFISLYKAIFASPPKNVSLFRFLFSMDEGILKMHLNSRNVSVDVFLNS